MRLALRPSGGRECIGAIGCRKLTNRLCRRIDTALDFNRRMSEGQKLPLHKKYCNGNVGSVDKAHLCARRGGERVVAAKRSTREYPVAPLYCLPRRHST